VPALKEEVVESSALWPESTVVAGTEITGVTSAGLTARLNVAAAVSATASATVRVTVNGEPAASLGVHLIEGEPELTHPSGRLVNA